MTTLDILDKLQCDVWQNTALKEEVLEGLEQLLEKTGYSDLLKEEIRAHEDAFRKVFCTSFDFSDAFSKNEDDTPKEMYHRMGFEEVDALYEYVCMDLSSDTESGKVKK